MLGFLGVAFLVFGNMPQVKMGLTGVAEVIRGEDGWEGGQGGITDEEERPTS